MSGMTNPGEKTSKVVRWGIATRYWWMRHDCYWWNELLSVLNGSNRIGFGLDLGISVFFLRLIQSKPLYQEVVSVSQTLVLCYEFAMNIT